MQKLILCKQSDSYELAHIYEHVMCMRIERMLYQRDVFMFLDYSLIGRAHRGVIWIEVELYTTHALTCLDDLYKVDLDINEDIVATAITQVLAEQHDALGHTGYDAIASELLSLHGIPWKDIDVFEQIDTSGLVSNDTSVYLADMPAHITTLLTVNLLIEPLFAKSNTTLLPLFRQCAWLIMATIQRALPEAHGYYSASDEFINQDDKVGLSNHFKVIDTITDDVDIQRDLDECVDILNELRDKGAFERLANELSAMTYRHGSITAPDLEANIRDTNVFVGSKGWRDIATQASIDAILGNIIIEVTYGNDTERRLALG